MHAFSFAFFLDNEKQQYSLFFSCHCFIHEVVLFYFAVYVNYFIDVDYNVEIYIFRSDLKSPIDLKSNFI